MSAQDSAQSASRSSDSADLAKQWAIKTENTAPEGEPADFTVDGDEYSSKWYALQAENSATNAQNSEDAAHTSETNAKTSETNAKTSETNAASSASAASESATNANSSSTAAQEAQSSAETARDEAMAAAKEAADVFATAVTFAPQTLTAEQQTQARANIGAAADADIVSVCNEIATAEG